ncbi:hypothetical protein [Bizionia saleffrena]|uniref:hypothetical protein n=1 Tax=Bizionia saleffrena TaxID=291189 RepID=UPI001C028B99|nr:hypothetical protein [Bizionia saleffrena]
MSKIPEQRILELEAKVKLLEKQKARAEHLAERADKKVIIFDMLVDMAEREYDIQNKKKLHTQVIDQYREQTKETIVSTCGLLGVNRQVYYRTKKSKLRKQNLAQQVIDLVRVLRMKMPRLGKIKLYYLLEEDLKKIKIGRDKLFRILQANHLLIIPRESYHITTDSHHRFRKHKNKVCNLKINKPEQVWISDITYVRRRENPSYLALITDAYSKKIVEV